MSENSNSNSKLIGHKRKSPETTAEDNTEPSTKRQKLNNGDSKPNDTQSKQVSKENESKSNTTETNNTNECEAVIFDMDGLMIDSEPFWSEAMIECFKTVNITLTKEDTDATTGIRIDEIVLMRYNQNGWNINDISLSDLTNKIINKVCSLIKINGIKRMKKGLKEILELIDDKQNIKYAIASSSPKILISTVMETLKPIIGDRFKVVCSAEGLEYGKPNPQVYLNAAKLLNVKPTNCLVFEDSLMGTLAAKSARMKCISIPENFPNQSIKFCIADKVLGALDDVSDEIWDELWNHSS